MTESRAGKTYILKEPVGPYFRKKYGDGPITIWIEDRDTALFEGGWGMQKGNPACLLFAMRTGFMSAQLGTEPVWYGKVKGLGELVIDTELGREVEGKGEKK